MASVSRGMGGEGGCCDFRLGTSPSRPVFIRPNWLKLSLKRVGYRGREVPRQLMGAAAEDVAGVAAAGAASWNAPLGLGEASLVAAGTFLGDHVILRLPKRGHYRGALLEDLFFAGAQLGKRGQLYFAGDFYVFCALDCTREDVVTAIAAIKEFRERFY